MAADSSKLAIDGGDPVRRELLKLHSWSYGEEELANLKLALESGWITRGPLTERFEREFAEWRKASHALAVSSCTAALQLALAVIGTQPGDEVITTPLTFASTANVAVHLGAKPVFADVKPDTLCLDPERAAAAVTDRTKAIIVVHYAGHPCNMDAFLELRRKHRVFIIEDCAHAVEAEYRGVPAGTMGDFGCFSFYATKNMTTGEGGMLACAEQRFRDEAEVWHLHGMSRAAWKRYHEDEFALYDIAQAGYKFNMSDLQAALGLAQMQRVDAWWERRREVVEQYDAAFGDMPGVRVLKRHPHVKSGLHIYPIILEPGAFAEPRDRIITALRAEGIQCYVHFPALHLTGYYRSRFGYQPGSFPVAEAAAANLVTLPLFPAMSDDDVRDVIDAVEKVLGAYHM